jgi:hypothetical protein
VVGEPNGTVYNYFGMPVINNRGQVNYFAQVKGVGVSVDSDMAIFSESRLGGPGLAFREGQQAPGAEPGVVFDMFWYGADLNQHGEMAVQGLLRGPGVSSANNSGVWKGFDATTMQLVMREGQQAPGLAPGVVFGEIVDETFARFQSTLFNEAGEVAAVVRLAGPGIAPNQNDWSAWLGDGGAPKLLARAGQSTTNPAGGPFAMGGNGSLTSLNDLGQVTILGGTTQSGGGLWVASAADGLNQVSAPAGLGKPIIGMINDNRVVAAFTSVGQYPAPVNNRVMRLYSSGASEVIIGPLAPGSSTQLEGMYPLINARNEVAVFGRAGFGGALSGIWTREENGPLVEVARTGDSVIGLMGNERLDFYSGAPYEFAFNNAGQVAFSAFIRDSSPFLRLALFATDVDGQLRTILRGGSSIDVDDGPGVDLRTVQSANFLNESWISQGVTQ